jgi:hypothetical protein
MPPITTKMPARRPLPLPAVGPPPDGQAAQVGCAEGAIHSLASGQVGSAADGRDTLARAA